MTKKYFVMKFNIGSIYIGLREIVYLLFGNERHSKFLQLHDTIYVAQLNYIIYISFKRRYILIYTSWIPNINIY